MKKGFGIFFIILGLGSFIQLVANPEVKNGGSFISLFILGGIGVWMISSANKEKEKERERKRKVENEWHKREIKAQQEANRIANQKKKEANRIDNQKKKELAELRLSQDQVLSELDKDGNGMVDDIEDNDDFNLLLKKHQKDIIEINRDYVKEFVKVSNYLKTKKKNIQKLFNSIKHTSNQKELNDYVGILKNEVHTYNLVLFNSLNMIVALIDDDMITFYEIHDSFDKLNMFNSNWENEVSQKLSNIGYGLNSLMYSINQMGQSIIQEIGELNYVTAESNQNLNSKLEEVDSSLKTNNLLIGIQTYQMYKVNKNTKKIN